jgi:hypothetical protein
MTKRFLIPSQGEGIKKMWRGGVGFSEDFLSPGHFLATKPYVDTARREKWVGGKKDPKNFGFFSAPPRRTL